MDERNNGYGSGMCASFVACVVVLPYSGSVYCRKRRAEREKRGEKRKEREIEERFEKLKNQVQ
jgi:hypothetical protein